MPKKFRLPYALLTVAISGGGYLYSNNAGTVAILLCGVFYVLIDMCYRHPMW